MLQTKKKTSVSLGSQMEIVEEMRHKEDRSRSAIIRRAIDYYYMMNYLPSEKAESADRQELKDARRDYKKGNYITLAELKQENACNDG